MRVSIGKDKNLTLTICKIETIYCNHNMRHLIPGASWEASNLGHHQCLAIQNWLTFGSCWHQIGFANWFFIEFCHCWQTNNQKHFCLSVFVTTIWLKQFLKLHNTSEEIKDCEFVHKTIPFPLIYKWPEEKTKNKTTSKKANSFCYLREISANKSLKTQIPKKKVLFFYSGGNWCSGDVCLGTGYW